MQLPLDENKTAARAGEDAWFSLFATGTGAASCVRNMSNDARKEKQQGET